MRKKKRTMKLQKTFKPEEIIEAVEGMKEQKKNHWFLTVRREMAIVRE